MSDEQRLDERIALEVMGDYRFESARLIDGRAFWWKHNGEIMESPPPYSTDIRFAWLVFEKIGRTRGWFINQAADGRWGVVRLTSAVSLSVLAPGRIEFDCLASAATAPLAICEAALDVLTPTEPTNE